MSGRLDRIPADVARRRSHYVLRVLPADPPARKLVVRATLSGGRPFEFTLDVRRYRVVAIEAESSTRWSNEPGAAVGGLIEVVTEQDLTRLTVSRRYAADGTRKIPIYEVLDAVEPRTLRPSGSST